MNDPRTRWLPKVWLLAAAMAVGCATASGGAAKSGAPAASKITVAESAQRVTAPEKSYAESGKGKPPAAGKVVDVLKGDEIVLEDGWVVRLTGIDVPTADYGKRAGQFYGKAALDFVKSRVLNTQVKLEFDQELTDPYDRALAYVWTADGKQLNQELVADGYALAACFPPNTRYCGSYTKAMKEAVRARKGLWNFNPNDWPKSESAQNSLEGVRVRTVIDGDTIQLEDGTVVRLIGIDAPESERTWEAGAFGHEAYEVMRKLVEGKTVSLEYDTEFSDPRGRELAYVYVQDGNKKIFVNDEMVRQGMAWVAVFPPNVARIHQLFEAQEEAYEQGRGLWKR